MGLKMWSVPMFNEQRGTFCVLIELEGIDPTLFPDPIEEYPTKPGEKKRQVKRPMQNIPQKCKLFDKFLALTVLISSQIMLITRSDKGMSELKAFEECDWLNRIKKNIIVGKDESDEFDPNPDNWENNKSE